MMSSFDVVEKMIIKLRKKLKAIGDLKERLAKGEKLEANQVLFDISGGVRASACVYVCACVYTCACVCVRACVCMYA